MDPQKRALANRRLLSSDESESEPEVLTTPIDLATVTVPPLEYRQAEPEEEPADIVPAKADGESRRRLQRLLQHDAEREQLKRSDEAAVDDTDCAVDQEEYLEWKLREFARLQRELGLLDADDQGHAGEVGESDEEATEGQLKFMQRYYHPGAFYQDTISKAERERLILEPTREDRYADKATLPAAMQVRGFGLRGQTKWTHLSKEDTTDHRYGWGLNDPSKRPRKQ